MRSDRREPMKTPGGNSVRTEIDVRIDEARAQAFEEAIAILRGCGHLVAADDLERAAFASNGASE